MRYSGSPIGPPRGTNQPDEQPGWAQVDHSRDPSHPNISCRVGFVPRRAGTSPVHTKGWDDWNGPINEDDTSSQTARMHRDTPNNSQQPADRYHPYRADQYSRGPATATPQVSKVGGRHMSGLIVIAAAGIFVIGVGVGIILMVSHGIHREQRRLAEARQYREQHRIGDNPDAPEYL